MTPQQIGHVQASFAQVVPIADQAAALFYGRLFEMTPETRLLFTDDIAAQGEKLMTAIAMVVGSLDRFDEVAAAVRDLARRHVAYGVQPEHYGAVGAALLWTLEQGLGAAFTPPVRNAWEAAYSALSQTMITAAYPDGPHSASR
jgi:hemoglobin-like flavoprotein